MNKKKSIVLIIVLFFSINNFSQEYNSLLIPPKLKENANAVVRNCLTEIYINDVDQMIVKEKRVITILNKVGNREVDTYAHYDDDTKINKLSVKIYNAFGKEIKKYSKSKFLDVSAVDGGTLYSDSRVKYIDYIPMDYPYTVVFEKEYKTSSTGFIPKWYPIESFYLSVEKSEFKIYNPKKIPLRKKEKNFANFNITNIKTSDHEVHYILNEGAAIEYENNTLSYIDIMPNVTTALDKFTLKKVAGYGNDWENFGKWMYENLLVGKNKLNPATISKVKNLVEGVNSDIEKAKIIYKYVQDKTRYISVQVGIGGWEPIPANEVDQVGYGDCKGLTNYTKALLDAVDVTSNYTVVFAKNRRDIDKDFSSLQGNHIILNLPNNGDDIWLECTSQTIPFGFLGDFTDDRNVLVVTPQGGKIKRTPSYKNKTNLQTSKANITLDNNGALTANVTRISKGIQYDDNYYIEDKSKEELKKYYKSSVWNYNNNLEINSVELKNDKNNVVFTEKLNVKIDEYATKNNNDLLFRVNVFNKNNYVPKRYRNRKLPLKIDRGYQDIDEYTINIPSDYSINLLPPKKKLKNKFGSYEVTIKKIDDHTLIYKKSLLIKEGIYPKEDYKIYRSFRKKIAKYENLRIALTKK